MKIRSIKKKILSLVLLNTTLALSPMALAQTDEAKAEKSKKLRAVAHWMSLADGSPAWSDEQGWADVANYTTIQAIDVAGDIHLIGRSDDGIIVHRWNGADWDMLSENTPAWSDGRGWFDVANFSTIQALDVEGELHLIGRSDGGIILQRWNGESWDLLANNSPEWSDEHGWADVTNYSTIQALTVGGVLHLVGRLNGGIITQRWNGESWDTLTRGLLPAWSDVLGWADVSNYSTIQALDVGGVLHLVGRSNWGILVHQWNGESWNVLADNTPMWSDAQGWADVANYSTIQALDVGGVLHLIGRLNSGIVAHRWNGTAWDTLTNGMPDWSDVHGWADVSNYATIQALDVGGLLHLVGRSNGGIIAHQWNGENWEIMANNSPRWSDAHGWADVTNYSTIKALDVKGVLHLVGRSHGGIHLLCQRESARN